MNMNKTHELDAYLTACFEDYAQQAIDGDYYGHCLDYLLDYYKKAVKADLKVYIEDNFDVPYVWQDTLVDMIFDSLRAEDYTEAYVGHAFMAATPAFDIGFPIQEIEVEIPEDFDGVESEKHCVSNGYAYETTDEIIIYRLDRDVLLERIEDALIELEE